MARTTEYRTEFTPNEADFRERIHPKKDFRLEDPEFSPKPYYQVFQEKHGFLPNLSIVRFAVRIWAGEFVDVVGYLWELGVELVHF